MPVRTWSTAAAVRLALALPPRIQVALSGGRPRTGDDGVLDPGLQLLLARRERRERRERRGGDEPDPGLAAARAGLRADVTATAGRTVAVGSVRDLTVDGAAGPLRARHYVPAPGPARVADRPAPLLVYLHGGGFMVGDLDTSDPVCRLLCRFAGTHVLSVEYRLAPEHPFPAAVDDAAAAWRWARANAAGLGADPARVGIGGDSAGANLAAVTSAATAGTTDAPTAQVLAYPVADATSRHPSRELYANGPLLTAEDIAGFEKHYEGTSRPDDPRRSPLLAPDVDGLPPTVLVTAAFDPLRDEGEAYARRLEAAGVPVTWWREPGLVHGFLGYSGVHGPSRDAAMQLAGAVRAVLAVSHARSAADAGDRWTTAGPEQH